MKSERPGAIGMSPGRMWLRLAARLADLADRLAPQSDRLVHRPTLVTVARLRTHGLGRDHGARAVYMPSDGSLICRACVDDDSVREVALSTNQAREQAVVLYGGWVRRTAFVDCGVHRLRLPESLRSDVLRAR